VSCYQAFFSFLYFKKNKITKIYGRSRKLRKWAPRQAFFVKKNLQTGPWAAQHGDSMAGGPVATPQRATGGPVALPSGDSVPPLYIRPPPSFPPHLSPKNPPKIQKKERGEENGSGEALPDCALVICR